MTDLLTGNTFFCVALTLVAFSVGSVCQKKWNKAILNPILIGAILVMVVLTLLDIPNSTYQAGCQILSYLLTPATICLAISFYEQFQTLKSHLPAVCLGVDYVDVETGEVYGGDELMLHGIIVKKPWGDYSSQQFHLKAL